MPIEIIDGFRVNRDVPIDTVRSVVSTLAERDAIPTGVRYQGMETRVIATKTKYVLEGGITNAHWKPMVNSSIPDYAFSDKGEIRELSGQSISGKVDVWLYPDRIYEWDEFSLLPDNDSTVLKTNDIAADKSGRFILRTELAVRQHTHIREEISDFRESDYLHTFSNETVHGNKTFRDKIIFPEYMAFIPVWDAISQSFIKSASTYYTIQYFFDKNDSSWVDFKSQMETVGLGLSTAYNKDLEIVLDAFTTPLYHQSLINTSYLAFKLWNVRFTYGELTDENEGWIELRIRLSQGNIESVRLLLSLTNHTAVSVGQAIAFQNGFSIVSIGVGNHQDNQLEFPLPHDDSLYVAASQNSVNLNSLRAYLYLSRMEQNIASELQLVRESVKPVYEPIRVVFSGGCEQIVILDENILLERPQHLLALTELSFCNVFNHEQPILNKGRLPNNTNSLFVPEGIYRARTTSDIQSGAVAFPHKRMGYTSLNKDRKGFNEKSTSTPNVSSVGIHYLSGGDFRIWLTCSGNDYRGVTIKDRVLILNSDGSVFRSDFGNYFTSYLNGLIPCMDKSGFIVWGQLSNSLFKGFCKLDNDGNFSEDFQLSAIGLTSSSGATLYPSGARVAPDGKIYIWASSLLARYNDIPVTGALFRLNADGTLDTSFSFIGAPSNHLTGICIQDDLKVLVYYMSKSIINGSAKASYCIRINPDGSTDNSFNCALYNDTIRGMILGQEGQLYVCGGSTLGINGETGYWRLLPDGSIDDTFRTDFSLGVNPHSNNGGRMYFTGDGKLMMIGNGISPLIHQGDELSNRLFRVNADGTLDRTFLPPVVLSSTGDAATLYSMAPMQDGAFMIGGAFVKCNGENKGALSKLNYNGFLR